MNHNNYFLNQTITRCIYRMAQAKEENMVEKLQEMNQVMQGIVKNPDYGLFLSNTEDISVVARNNLVKKFCKEFHDRQDSDQEKIMASKLLCTLFLMSDIQVSKCLEDYQGSLNQIEKEYNKKYTKVWADVFKELEDIN